MNLRWRMTVLTHSFLKPALPYGLRADHRHAQMNDIETVTNVCPKRSQRNVTVGQVECKRSRRRHLKQIRQLLENNL